MAANVQFFRLDWRLEIQVIADIVWHGGTFGSRRQIAHAHVSFVRMAGGSHAGHRQSTVGCAQWWRWAVVFLAGRNEGNVAVMHRLIFVHQDGPFGGYSALTEGRREPGERLFSRNAGQWRWRSGHCRFGRRLLLLGRRFDRWSRWGRFGSNGRLVLRSKSIGGWYPLWTNGHFGRICWTN